MTTRKWAVHATTILAVRHRGGVALGGDGQVTVGETVIKHNASKVRTLKGGTILAGFAGAAADGFTLFEKFEEKLDRHPANLSRAAVELAKDWRSDRVLRRLDALLAVVNREHSFLISGSGDVIEPDDGILAIGSGGSYALSAARALVEHSELSAAEIVRRGLQIAADVCIYTNDHISVLELKGDADPAAVSSAPAQRDVDAALARPAAAKQDAEAAPVAAAKQDAEAAPTAAATSKRDAVRQP